MKINSLQSKRKLQSGMTLIELVIVIVVLSILIATGSAQLGSTNEMMLSQQAKKFASQIRHAQFLATNWGCEIGFTVTGTNYEATSRTDYTGIGKTKCGAGNVINDPASFENFTITLQDSATFSSSPDFYFDSLGRPRENDAVSPAPGTLSSANQQYDMTLGSSTWRIIVNPLTGFVSASAI